MKCDWASRRTPTDFRFLPPLLPHPGGPRGYHTPSCGLSAQPAGGCLCPNTLTPSGFIQDPGIIRISNPFPFLIKGRQPDCIPQGAMGRGHPLSPARRASPWSRNHTGSAHFLLWGGPSSPHPSPTPMPTPKPKPSVLQADNSWQHLRASPVPPSAPTPHPSLPLPPVPHLPTPPPPTQNPTQGL